MHGHRRGWQPGPDPLVRSSAGSSDLAGEAGRDPRRGPHCRRRLRAHQRPRPEAVCESAGSTAPMRAANRRGRRVPRCDRDGWDVDARGAEGAGLRPERPQVPRLHRVQEELWAVDGNVPGSVSRVDAPCWPLKGTAIAAHELGHGLGAVAGDAPHYSGWGHCNESADLMCNGEQSDGDPVVRNCPSWQRNWFDCGNDDYFSTDPAPVPTSTRPGTWPRSPYLDTSLSSRRRPRPRDGEARARRQGRVREGTGSDRPRRRRRCGDRLDLPGDRGLVSPPDVVRRVTGRRKRDVLVSATGRHLGIDHRPGTRLQRESRLPVGRVVLRAAPVHIEVVGRARAGRPFTATATGGGDDHVLWSWGRAPGCKKKVRGPVANFDCPAKMSGRSIPLKVTAFRLSGDRVSVQRQVRLAG